MDNFRLCIVIPCYNHALSMGLMLGKISTLGVQCIVVNDGSDDDNRRILGELGRKYPDYEFIDSYPNQGKGSAVHIGLMRAQAMGFTHALQIDADGQHDPGDIPKFIETARANPLAVISGRPVFDRSVPLSRRLGRKITNFWTGVETLSCRLKDTMCGFRVYPLDVTLNQIGKIKRLRMTFDIEIMVRLYWEKVRIIYIPTHVTYPSGGSSSFRMFGDNLQISAMHTRLCLMMPCRMFRRCLIPGGGNHWAEEKELRGYWGMQVMVCVYRAFGRLVFRLLLYPVVLFYYLFASRPRKFSKAWLRLVRERRRELNMEAHDSLSSYRHFYNFALSMLDKIASWNGKLRMGREVHYAPGAEECLKKGLNQRGRLIIGSHLGDLEVCRALSQGEGAKAINALVFTDHARRFKAIMDRFAPQSGINVIAVDNIDIASAWNLKEKIDNGEMVAIVGDRIPVRTGRNERFRVSLADFMGKKAPFAQGPFILASLLSCPVILLFALREKDGLKIYASDFADRVVLSRGRKEQDLRGYIQRYASELERQALAHPLDWFNFYDFYRGSDYRGRPGRK